MDFECINFEYINNIDKLIDIIKNYPKLDVGIRNGPTNYIDYITTDEVKYPVMYGIDKFSRMFVVIKARINNTIIQQTFFQRHTNYKYFWTTGNLFGNIILLDSLGGLHLDQLIFIIELIKNGKAKLEDKHDAISLFKEHSGEMVYLYNEKEWKAASKIQKNWRICRYNPSYKMCEKVLFSNLDIIQNNNFNFNIIT